MANTTLITNRTEADIERARIIIAKMQAGETLSNDERAEYFDGLRGCYNISDLNRVENKVAELSERLNNGGYNNAVNARTWEAGEILTDAEIGRYLANIAAIRAAYYVKDETPQTPVISQWIDYEIANDIEKILSDIEALIDDMAGSSPLSGTFYAGARRALPLRRS
jgi:hypothetical protein